MQLIIDFKKQGYGQWAKGRRSLYVHGIREALGEEVAMGDVKSMKHHPNVK